MTDEQMDVLQDLVDQVADDNGCTRTEALEEVISFLECGIEVEASHKLAAQYGAVGPTGEA